MARAKTVQSVIASVSNAAAGTTRGAIDVRERDGGVITLKMTNGGTGPTAPCQARVMIAHDTGTTPATGGAGAVWKTVAVYIGSITSNVVREFSFDFGPAPQHIQVECTENTGQAVTVEAIASTFNYSA